MAASNHRILPFCLFFRTFSGIGFPFYRYAIGKKAAIAANKIAGSRLATRIFLSHTRFMPTQKIRMDPTREIYMRFLLCLVVCECR